MSEPRSLAHLRGFWAKVWTPNTASLLSGVGGALVGAATTAYFTNTHSWRAQRAQTLIQLHQLITNTKPGQLTNDSPQDEVFQVMDLVELVQSLRMRDWIDQEDIQEMHLWVAGAPLYTRAAISSLLKDPQGWRRYVDFTLAGGREAGNTEQSAEVWRVRVHFLENLQANHKDDAKGCAKGDGLKDNSAFWKCYKAAAFSPQAAAVEQASGKV